MTIVVLSIIALILSLTGNILVNLKHKTGFVIWSVSNIFWILVNFIGTLNIPQILMFTAYIGLNIHGFIMWSKKEKVND